MLDEPLFWFFVGLGVWCAVALVVAAVMYAEYGPMGDGSEFFAFFWPFFALGMAAMWLVRATARLLLRAGLVKPGPS